MAIQTKVSNWFKKNQTNNFAYGAVESATEQGNEPSHQNERDATEQTTEPHEAEQARGDVLSVARDQLDQTDLDLVIAVENTIKKRRFEWTKLKDLQQQLHELNNELDRLKSSKQMKEEHIAELEERIRIKDEQLMNKQMRYDQLVEDYEDYQNQTRQEIDNLKSRIAEEAEKYATIVQEFNAFKHDTVKTESEYQEEIRSLKAEKQEMTERYQKTLQEKNHLLQTISDFTNRMSVSPFQSVEETNN